MTTITSSLLDPAYESSVSIQVAERKYPAVYIAGTQKPRFFGQPVIIDGMNAMCPRGKQRPYWTRFLSILVPLSAESSNVLCLFDANVWHTLNNFSTAHAAAFRRLERQFPHRFVTTPGCQADDIILPQAEYRGAPIVSGDTFQQPQYLARFPWISQPGRILSIVQVDDMLHVGHDFLCPLRHDLENLLDETTSNLAKMDNRSGRTTRGVTPSLPKGGAK